MNKWYLASRLLALQPKHFIKASEYIQITKQNGYGKNRGTSKLLLNKISVWPKESFQQAHNKKWSLKQIFLCYRI